ncbi:MAG: hypothetical protein CME59_00530 [Halioglobus sp.]|nr:hypothetical protein [Halioglobus sp.]|tara:strand:+ start:6752 stop:7837 length:1086 start_codon:yes stop_codon:yes gene_type:complete
MYKSQYSGTDRALHRLAFSSWGLQAALSDMEDSLFRSRLSQVEAERPVFITALPRAGTTLLLELLADTGEFSTHTYRHMPFLLCPLLWEGFSRRFRKSGELRERAHGDGVQVSEDSPEAFEEVIWRHYWKRYYQQDHIEPWGKVRHKAFERFFQAHMRKIVAMGGDSSPGMQRRYLSKNNLNIARVRYLQRALPGCSVIVLFRDPYEHAASLLRQHLNFLEQHRADAFSRWYMEGIGHYDFGANLKPVDFGNWMQSRHAGDATTIEYWLCYWHACYAHLLAQAGDATYFYSFEAMCEDPDPALDSLAQRLDLAEPPRLLEQAGRISVPARGGPEPGAIDASLHRQVYDLWRELRQAASTPQ